MDDCTWNPSFSYSTTTTHALLASQTPTGTDLPSTPPLTPYASGTGQFGGVLTTPPPPPPPPPPYPDGLGDSLNTPLSAASQVVYQPVFSTPAASVDNLNTALSGASPFVFQPAFSQPAVPVEILRAQAATPVLPLRVSSDGCGSVSLARLLPDLVPDVQQVPSADAAAICLVDPQRRVHPDNSRFGSLVPPPLQFASGDSGSASGIPALHVLVPALQQHPSADSGSVSVVPPQQVPSSGDSGSISRVPALRRVSVPAVQQVPPSDSGSVSIQVPSGDSGSVSRVPTQHFSVPALQQCPPVDSGSVSMVPPLHVPSGDSGSVCGVPLLHGSVPAPQRVPSAGSGSSTPLPLFSTAACGLRLSTSPSAQQVPASSGQAAAVSPAPSFGYSYQHTPASAPPPCPSWQPAFPVQFRPEDSRLPAQYSTPLHCVVPEQVTIPEDPRELSSSVPSSSALHDVTSTLDESSALYDVTSTLDESPALHDVTSTLDESSALHDVTPPLDKSEFLSASLFFNSDITLQCQPSLQHQPPPQQHPTTPQHQHHPPPSPQPPLQHQPPPQQHPTTPQHQHHPPPSPQLLLQHQPLPQLQPTPSLLLTGSGGDDPLDLEDRFLDSSTLGSLIGSLPDVTEVDQAVEALGQLGGGGLPDTEGQSGAVLDVELEQAVETFGQPGGGGLPDTEGQSGAVVDVEVEQREAQVPTGAVDVGTDLDPDLDLEANEDFRDASSFVTKSLLRDKVVQKYSKEGKRLPDIGPQPPAPSQQELTEEEKQRLLRKRLGNKISAQKSREKKKKEKQSLIEEIQHLECRNVLLTGRTEKMEELREKMLSILAQKIPQRRIDQSLWEARCEFELEKRQRREMTERDRERKRKKPEGHPASSAV